MRYGVATMKAVFRRSEARGGALAAVVLSVAAVAALGLAAGCKNNPPAVESGGAAPVAIPVLHALPASGEVLKAEVLTSPLWRGAAWMNLSPPLNDTRTTPSTRVACLYDAEKLYIAFAGATTEGRPGGTTAAVLLDSSKLQNGTEFFEISVDPETVGDASIRGMVWHRPTLPPAPNPDGTVNYTIPVSRVTGFGIKDLQVVAGKGQVDGQAGWTVVFAIPMRTLPGPLKGTPAAGVHWRVNLLRQDELGGGLGAGRREVVQGNLSPVFLGAQAVMPYRMAELVLMPGPVAQK